MMCYLMSLLICNAIHKCIYVMIKHYITSSLYSSTIINIIHFVNNSVHSILIQSIKHMSFNISSIHHPYLVKFHIKSSFISFSLSMNSHIVHLHLMRLFTPQVLMINHQISIYECELYEK